LNEISEKENTLAESTKLSIRIRRSLGFIFSWS